MFLQSYIHIHPPMVYFLIEISFINKLKTKQLNLSLSFLFAIKILQRSKTVYSLFSF